MITDQRATIATRLDTALTTIDPSTPSPATRVCSFAAHGVPYGGGRSQCGVSAEAVTPGSGGSDGCPLIGVGWNAARRHRPPSLSHTAATRLFRVFAAPCIRIEPDIVPATIATPGLVSRRSVVCSTARYTSLPDRSMSK